MPLHSKKKTRKIHLRLEAGSYPAGAFGDSVGFLCPNGKKLNIQVPRDGEGYLIDPDDWTQDIAHQLAREEGIELDEKYWPVLSYIRSYYAEHLITPDVRHVVKNLANELGYGKKEAKEIIFELFPYGYVQQACKISGMKRPRAWSTG